MVEIDSKLAEALPRRFLRLPVGTLSEEAMNLLRGSGLKSRIAWEDFDRFMDRVATPEEAVQLLLYLDHGSHWTQREYLNQRYELRGRSWIPGIGRERLTLAGARNAGLISGELFSFHFQQWLFGMEGVSDTDTPLPGDELEPEDPVVDPVELLTRIEAWWSEEGKDRSAWYEQQLYGEHRLRLNSLKRGSSLQERREWLRLFILALGHRIGRTEVRQHRAWLEMFERQGWLDIVTDPESTPEEWLGIIDRYFEDSLARVQFGPWLGMFPYLRAVACHLEVYVSCLADLEKLPVLRTPADVLNPATSSLYSGSGRLAPPGTDVLGIGACYLLRELRRTGFLATDVADEFCFVPKASVRRFVAALDGQNEPARRFEGAKEVAERLKRIKGGELPTFQKGFDLPLMILSENTQLCRDVLGQEFSSRLLRLSSGEAFFI